MKKLLYICLAVLFIGGIAFLADAAEMTFDKAAAHIGEEATVCGKIIDKVDIGTALLLGMGASAMDAKTVGIEINYSLVSKLPADTYIGKTICVTGKIYKNPLGGGSIKVDDLSQIQVK